MANKVVLPKEVAEAITAEKDRGYSNQQILTFPYNMYPKYSSRDVVQKYRVGNFDKLVSALYNGYEAERTPHDNIRTLYFTTTGGSFDRGVNWGIEKTLELLGITVEGINEKEANPCL